MTWCAATATPPPTARSARSRSGSALAGRARARVAVLLQSSPKTIEVRMDGTLRSDVTAKDIIWLLCKSVRRRNRPRDRVHRIVIRALSMEERMTVCNMSIEAGARAGMIAPDKGRSST